MPDKKIYDKPSKVTAEDGVVTLEGPDAVDVCMTPEAADETRIRPRDDERDGGDDHVHEREPARAELAQKERVARGLQHGVARDDEREEEEREARRARLPLADIDQGTRDTAHAGGRPYTNGAGDAAPRARASPHAR